jgi:hypothetical protein
MKNNNLISLTAKASSGKDLVASIIQYLTSECSSVDGNHYRTFEEFSTYGKNRYNDYTLWYESDYQIKKWAGPLRKVASILLGMDEQYLYTKEFKESILPDYWDQHIEHISIPTSGRQFLQLLGTDAIRMGLHTDAWINALMAEYKSPKMSKYNPSKWVVSDTRFENELQAIKDRNGICIKIVRPSLVSTDSHSSETSLDHITDWDHVIINDGTIEDLIGKVRAILEQEGIL